MGADVSSESFRLMVFRLRRAIFFPDFCHLFYFIVTFLICMSKYICELFMFVKRSHIHIYFNILLNYHLNDVETISCGFSMEFAIHINIFLFGFPSCLFVFLNHFY